MPKPEVTFAPFHGSMTEVRADGKCVGIIHHSQYEDVIWVHLGEKGKPGFRMANFRPNGETAIAAAKRWVERELTSAP